ncbi:MAG TPA: hypothetical protein V6D17_13600, partial [Candidatus Obscuribacterales bacterium]
GYSIGVTVNGQMVDKFFSPGKKVDITRFVKSGENQIAFDATLLPSGMREHEGNSGYYLKVTVYSGPSLESTKDVNELLNYKRDASENQNFSDNLSFVTLE